MEDAEPCAGASDAAMWQCLAMAGGWEWRNIPPVAGRTPGYRLPTSFTVADSEPQ
jgi:hypothetical protein